MHAPFCIWLKEMYPSIDDSTIMMGGTSLRNNWRIRLGRYPVMTWLTTVLQIKKLYNSASWNKSEFIFKSCRFCTYKVSMLVRKGNQVSKVERLARPCTITTGMRYRIVRAAYATSTTSLQIHLFMKDEEKKGQWTSWGSGALSVTHSVGFVPCWMCKATAAASRDLNDTKAAETSCYCFFGTMEQLTTSIPGQINQQLDYKLEAYS